MYLLALLTLCGVAVAVPLAEPVAVFALSEQDRRAAYVLPTDTIPTFYDVSLYLDPDNEKYFYGSVDIRILPLISTNRIVLHAMEMEIESKNIEVVSDRAPSVNLYQSHRLALDDNDEDDTNFFSITLNQNMTVLQPHTIRIKHFYGLYAEDIMSGIYVSTYQEGNQTQNFITSQLQPTYARRAFPCYDEPAKKAVFRITIYAPPSYTVVRSNTNPQSELLKPEVPGFTKHEFQDTPVMSTYSLAFLVSNFQVVTNENIPEVDRYRLPIRVYSRPGLTPPDSTATAFAMAVAQKAMKVLEEYLDFHYIGEKLDMVAVPDFGGAMENLGLTIYREDDLLVTDGVTTTAAKQNVAKIICHEIAHQWFGNLVTPRSWKYLFLSEGFATFLGNYVCDKVFPKWRMMDQFELDCQNVFQFDAVLSVNPMTHAVYTPSEIIGTFNAVAYQKSGCVFRMMKHFLTPEVFRQGLVAYIRNNALATVSPTELYAAMQQALDHSPHSIPFALSDVMRPLVNQGGFPVLTVKRSATDAESIVVEQDRFLTDNTLQSNDRWCEPINWVLSSNPNFEDTSPQGWICPATPARSFDIPGLSSADWYIVNKQQTGYYRVNYDNGNWAALAVALNENHEVINILNRAQILDDAFNLARNGRLNYEYPFRLSSYLEKEKDYIPWGAINPSFTYLDTVLSNSPVYSLFQKYILHLTKRRYEELGFDADDDEEHEIPDLRNIILDLNCRHGNEHCIQQAQEKLDGFRNNRNERLNPDIQTLIYCSGLRGGSAENFDFLWGLYVASQDSSEQSILLNSLGCTSNVEKRTSYLNQVISDDSAVRIQDRDIVLVSVINAGPNSTEAALDFVIEHFDKIQLRVQAIGTTNILNAFAEKLTTKTHQEKIDELVRRHQSILSAGEQASISGIREDISSSITWVEKYAEDVDSWLKNNYGNSASTVVSSPIVLISVVVIISSIMFFIVCTLLCILLCKSLRVHL